MHELLDRTLSFYEFGENIIITESSKWNEESESHFVCRLTVDILDGKEITKDSITFHVMMKNGRVTNSYGYLSTGQVV